MITEKQGARLFQMDFFDSVSPGEFEVKGPPTRTLSTFWHEDILPTAIKMRRIYTEGYQDADDEVLESVWYWLGKEENKVLMGEATLQDEKIIRRLPDEVVLNFDTAHFLMMGDDFKRDQRAGLFEPFVAYTPGTLDWENDIRRITFGYIDSLRRRPLELDKLGKAQSRADISGVLVKFDDNIEMVRRYETMDSITWTAMMKYYLALLKREKEALEFQKPLTVLLR